MANTYFQFKQFTVRQEDSAMKVCTDSCIFGAWIKEPGAKNILDIGTGTGLLALMLAQTHQAKIDAVEIDEKAFLQAVENVQESPWKDSISVYRSDIVDFSVKINKLYDVIICNPPFYKNHLLSKNHRKNKVLHDNLLPLEKLVSSIKRLLAPEGKFYVMLPQWQSLQLEKMLSKENLWPQNQMSIKEKAGNQIIRVLTSYTNYKVIPAEDYLIIRNKENTYSDDFKTLLKDFYLYL